jgi:hypothetical protein
VSRPARSPHLRSRPGASLEVLHVPFSTRRSRRALAPEAAGLRTYPAAAFTPAPSARARFAGPRSACVRPCGFSLLRRDRRGVARSGGRSGWVVRSSLTCRADSLATRLCVPTVSRSRVRRSRRRDPRRLPVRRAGAVGVADSSCFALFVSRFLHCAPARSRRTRRSERYLYAASISPPEPGHAPTRPLARCSATRRSGSHAALPDERSFPLNSSGGAPGVL